ncbi:hypothetical protein JCM10908_003232 [Rhodotorula pacifica]|uniref:uncharacterized protein n=1 Tax=Rhodotorula pacifica TaxID=1495444 RepID=UPI003170B696
MHLRAASSPQEASKPVLAQSESAKANKAAPRSGTVTSSEPRPRRHSAQTPAAAAAMEADKENQFGNNKSTKGAKVEPKAKKQPPQSIDIPAASKMSTPADSANKTQALLAPPPAHSATGPPKRKSNNAKAFQSTVSPLMHFDEPAPLLLPSLFNGLAIGGNGTGGGDARSFSGLAAPQQHSVNYAQQQQQQAGAGYLSVPTSPTFFSAGFSPQPYSAAASGYPPYYYAHPTDFSAFLQGYSAPSPPGTPLSASDAATPTSASTAAPRHQQQQQLYPPSLGLGHPYIYATTPGTQSANTSLSLSSVAASSLGFSPANSRSTSASSAISTSTGGSADMSAYMYPFPYAYYPPSRGVSVGAGGGVKGERTTIRERLEGGAVLQSRGACKFFDVEKGFGFIIDDHAEEVGADVFIHYTGIEQTRGFRCLAQDERVEYALVKHSSGGFQALKLRGEHGAPLKGLGDPKQAAAFDRMNSKAAAIWSEDEENVCPPGSIKGRRRFTPAYYKANGVRVPPRIQRTPAAEDAEEDTSEEAE